MDSSTRTKRDFWLGSRRHTYVEYIHQDKRTKDQVLDRPQQRGRREARSHGRSIDRAHGIESNTRERWALKNGIRNLSRRAPSTNLQETHPCATRVDISTRSFQSYHTSDNTTSKYHIIPRKICAIAWGRAARDYFSSSNRKKGQGAYFEHRAVQRLPHRRKKVGF